MSKPTILFDLDGTLIDSTSAILGGFFAAFEHFKLKAPASDEICSLVGHPLEVMFSSLGVKDSLVAKFVDIYRQNYKNCYIQETTLLNGALPALSLAKDFADLGVVTTKTSVYSKLLLEHLGVVKFFKTIVGRDDVLRPKPDPEPIMKALLNLNKTYKNAFMIGDTLLDIRAAKSANICPIAVSIGYGKEEDLKKECEIVVEDSLHAVRFIKNSLSL